jgi:sugar lactone lactonase YvrE
MPGTIAVTDLEAVGHGLQRPETVLVTRGGEVYASDKDSAVAEILADGSLRRIGKAGGEPNGIAVDASGQFLIANFGLGQLQKLDPATGDITVLLADQVDGRSLQWLNYVLVDSSGVMWASVSTASSDVQDTIANGWADGYIVRLEPDGSDARIVADGVDFPNCMALDRDQEFLYVVRTTAVDVVRFRIDGTNLGRPETFSPPLSEGRPSGVDTMTMLADPEAAKRWGLADGCAFDDTGNLWVTLLLSNRVVAVTPGREVVPVIDDPDGDVINTPTSVAWGGADMKDVYFGCLARPYVLKGRSSVPGLPLVHQRGGG